MAVVLLQSISEGFGNSAAARTKAFASNVVGGNTIVVCITTYSTFGVTLALTDSLGNVYTRVGNYSINGDHRTSMWYAVNIAGGACTLTSTPSAITYQTIALHEYSGLKKASPLDDDDDLFGTGTSQATGVVTIGKAGELVIASIGYNGDTGGTPTVASPFAVRQTVAYSAGVRLGLSTGDDQNALVSEAATFTSVNSIAWVSKAASFILEAPAPVIEIAAGPPMRGAPWLQRLPVEPSQSAFAPNSPQIVGGDLIYAPEISVGPIAHAPWMGSRLLINDGLKVPPYGGAAPPVVLPVGPGTGKKKNFLRRAPSRIQSPERQKLREAQNADFLHNLVNSLIRQGVLFQTSAGEWILRGGGFSEPRKPLATDDRTRGMNIGNTWIDSSEQAAWVCISNAENAAVWKRITSPVADGQYTVGLGVSTDGKLTLADGEITKIQSAT